MKEKMKFGLFGQDYEAPHAECFELVCGNMLLGVSAGGEGFGGEKEEGVWDGELITNP